MKRFLGEEQAFLIPEKALEEIGLAPGIISPVIEPVWSFKHLISEGILDLPYVSTNNGTRHEYFKFDPRILLQAKNVAIGDFEA